MFKNLETHALAYEEELKKQPLDIDCGSANYKNFVINARETISAMPTIEKLLNLFGFTGLLAQILVQNRYNPQQAIDSLVRFITENIGEFHNIAI